MRTAIAVFPPKNTHAVQGRCHVLHYSSYTHNGYEEAPIGDARRVVPGRGAADPARDPRPRRNGASRAPSRRRWPRGIRWGEAASRSRVQGPREHCDRLAPRQRPSTSGRDCASAHRWRNDHRRSAHPLRTWHCLHRWIGQRTPRVARPPLPCGGNPQAGPLTRAHAPVREGRPRSPSPAPRHRQAMANQRPRGEDRCFERPRPPRDSPARG